MTITLHIARSVVLTLALFSAQIWTRAGQTGVIGVEDPRVRPLLNATENGSEDDRTAAMSQLANMHLPAEKGVPIFAAHLVRKTCTLSEALEIAHAVDGLAEYGVLAKSTIPALVQLADDVETPEAQ